MTDTMTAMDMSSSEYKVYITAKLDAAVVEMDNSSLALTSLSASLVAKVKSALLISDKTWSAIIADALTAASQTLIGDAGDTQIEDHGSAANTDALIHKLKTFDANSATSSDDLASQHLMTGCLPILPRSEAKTSSLWTFFPTA